MINNKIEEDFCSFEVSKLLKEKGFDCNCQWHYEVESKGLTFHAEYENFKNSEIQNGYGKLKYQMISAPTHSIAIKWIRENFGIHFSIDLYIDMDRGYNYKPIIKMEMAYEDSTKDFTIPMYKAKGNPWRIAMEVTRLKYEDSIQEAIETTIIYSLTNLIN